jgi:glycogen synthase
VRVLMVTPRRPLLQGGVERHVMEVARRLAASGTVVEVLCAQPGEPPSAEQVDGVTIRSVRAWPAGRDWSLAPGLWRAMAREPWDVIHIQSYHTFVAPLAMLRALTLRVPYVVTFHAGGHSSPLRNRLRGAQRRALAPLLRRAARLVALARFEIVEYGRELGLPADRFAYIPNGVDLGEPAAEPADRTNGAPVLATIGRLERYKGHHRAIAALPHVLAQRPDARLLVVGSGPYEAELRRCAGELGVREHVEFLSVPPDDRQAMADLLSEISLVVLMSEFETHPLVALEAAAMRRRLLVADRGGLLELAQDGLARAVAVDAPPQRLAEAALEELAKPRPTTRPALMSWDRCTRELQELYRSVTS